MSYRESPNESPKSIDSLIREGYATDISSYLGRGWDLLQQKLGSFIGFTAIFVFVIPIALAIIAAILDPASVDPSTNRPSTGIAPLLNAASFIVSPALEAGFYLVALKLAKQRLTSFSDFFRGFHYFLPLLLARLVTSILIVLGFLLLIIPGIYLAVAYGLVFPLILERKMDFWQAMETSRRVITKRWFSFFGLGLLLFLINLVGLLPFGLGLLITIPLSYCTYIAAYESVFGLQLSSDE
ncbi:hypothetical protein [Thermocoleostomius sinensis]|jgi:hypothetical protein|uniref:DUF975 family protein n=1 Tax=Thermocoleostomius sinensis A174 TaxID=2016057 RepID=A0A9E9C5U2_9CYAN|nr:hypothetical protein [Thermocoleostomius sinensis]WAL58549.1 hypothetical protein OXH18_15325 [Thermocoleostomius sinensis A174]